MTLVFEKSLIPAGHSSVRSQHRPKGDDRAIWQDYELFPTPPWATRTLCELVLPAMGFGPSLGLVEEPAAGLGHMSEALKDYAASVRATDIHCYRLDGGGDTELLGIEQADFLGAQVRSFDPDWVITNPPFGKAAEFLARALAIARAGVAMILRMQWLESADRFTEIFSKTPPALVAQFAERVPMCEGGWDPKGTTATAYAWFIWARGPGGAWMAPRCRESVSAPAFEGAPLLLAALDFALIPPICRTKFSKPSDARLATRCVPGWVAPSRLKKSGAAQATMGI